MADEPVNNPLEANQKLMQNMIDYAGSITKDEIPENAVRWIVGILRDKTSMRNFYQNNASSSKVIQVDYNFSGRTTDGKQWEIRFSINADAPNTTGQHQAHYGGEIDLNRRRVKSIHKWLPENKLPAGRPNDKDYGGIEEFLSGQEQKTFPNGDSAQWICMPKKIGH